ncbi:MAG: hypothetical protein KDI15_04885, partial [Thiothrix sp.]|nr:hypothetical protein [Thiothrix sp.]
MIDNRTACYSQPSTQTRNTGNAQGERAGNKGRAYGNQPAFNNNPPAFIGGQFQDLMALLQQLLEQLQNPAPAPTPAPTPNPTPSPVASVPLSPSGQDQLRQLLGFNANAPFSVNVLDNDGNGQLSVGDTAVVNGGITGGEILRHDLTDADITRLNPGQGQLLADFQDNYAKWQNFSNRHADLPVSYTTQQTCFCPQEITQPLNVTEINGEIVSVTDINGQPVPDYVRDSVSSIGERFEQLQNAYLNGAESIRADYDPTLGFPTSVLIDQSSMIADEEVSYTISNLNYA